MTEWLGRRIQGLLFEGTGHVYKLGEASIHLARSRPGSIWMIVDYNIGISSTEHACYIERSTLLIEIMIAVFLRN